MIEKLIFLVAVSAGLICPPAYVQYGSAEKCLRSILYEYTRDDGQAICEEDGGNLAAVMNEDEMAFMTAYVEIHHEDWWLGLNDIEAEGSFVWSDGSPAEYTSWKYDEPDKDYNCVALDDDVYWRTRDCTRDYNVLCQWVPPVAHVVPVSFNMARFYKQDTFQKLDFKEELVIIRLRYRLACAAKCSMDLSCTAISYSPTSNGDNCVLWTWADPGSNNSEMIDWNLFVKY